MVVGDGVLATTNGLSEKPCSDLQYGVGLWHETKEIQQSISLLEQHVQSLFDAVKDGFVLYIPCVSDAGFELICSVHVLSEQLRTCFV